MSFPFFRNFIKAGGTQAAESLTAALVRAAPEAATKAELAAMEEDLDNAGRVITRLQSELSEEQHRFNAVNARYSEMATAAEILQQQIDDPSIPEAKRQSLMTSLDGLLTKIEGTVPDLDRERADLEATEALLRDAEAAYQDKSKALLAAKSNLERAKHDMEHAHLEEERAQKRAEDARAIAGLQSRSSSGLSVALDAMNKSAQEARERAAANTMKAKALSTAEHDGEDENVKNALAQAKGQSTEKSLAERLAALKR